MKSYRHGTAAVAMVILATALIFAALSQTAVNAQESNDAIVIIQTSQGGTTDPEPGTHTYPEGTEITLTATADSGYTFQYWIASGGPTPGHDEGQHPVITDPETGETIVPAPPLPSISGIDSLVFTSNPAIIDCGYGFTYTYQAVFAQTDGAGDGDTEAVVVVLPSSDGTTDPEPGTHTYPEGTKITLTATPNEGYSFHYWVISGNVTPGHAGGEGGSIIIDPETGETITTIPRPPQLTGMDSLVVDVNPIEIECGFGYTFAYQAVFTPTDETGHSPSPVTTTSPGVTGSPTVTATVSPGATATGTAPTGGQIIEGIDDWILIAIVIIVIIIIVAAIAAAMRRR